MQAVFLKVLLMFAPLAFAMSIAPPWSSAWSQWISKYATISLWGFLVYLFVFYADFVLNYSLQKDIVAYTTLIGKAKGTWTEIGSLGILCRNVCRSSTFEISTRSCIMAYSWRCK